MSNLDVSIVIPVYNREQVLARSLSSVFAQEDVRMEIIAVDDGSSDGSLAELERLASQKNAPQMRIISLKENTGQANARNRAIEIANGAFIAMLDSDDMLHGTRVLHDWVAQARARHTQILVARTSDFLNDKEHFSRHWHSPTNVTGTIRNLHELVNVTNCWQCLYERRFLEANHIEFSRKLRQREDRLYLIQAFLKADRIGFTNLLTHRHYKDQENSTMRDRSIGQLEMFITHIEELAVSFRQARREGRSSVHFELVNAFRYFMNIGRYWRPVLKACYHTRAGRPILRRLAFALTLLKEGLPPFSHLQGISEERIALADLYARVLEQQKLWLLRKLLHSEDSATQVEAHLNTAKTTEEKAQTESHHKPVRNQKRICYLHVGMPKTGSTAIQQALMGFESDTITYGNFIPRMSNHGQLIYTLFEDEPWEYHKYRKLGYSKQQVLELRAAYGRIFKDFITRDKRDLILSAESLSNLNRVKGISNLLHFLAQHFDEIRPVCYLRRVAEFLPSRFQQRIRYGSYHSYEWEIAYPKFRDTLGAFTKTLPHSPPDLRVALPGHLIGGSTVSDICSVIGIPQQKENRSNPSITFESLCLLLAHRILGEEEPFPAPIAFVSGRSMTRALRRYGQLKARISERGFARVLDVISDDVRWMAEQMPLDTRVAYDLLTTHPAEKSAEVSIDRPYDCLDFAGAHLEYVQSLLPGFQPRGLTELDKTVSCLNRLKRKFAEDILRAQEILREMLEKLGRNGLMPAPIHQVRHDFDMHLEKISHPGLREMHFNNFQMFLSEMPDFKEINGMVVMSH